MTTDLAANLGQQRLAGERARHRHDWATNWNWHGDLENPAPYPVVQCVRCNAIRDEARSARGRSSRSRGNRRELELARALGGDKVGMFGGPVDVQTPLVNAQSKVRRGAAFPSWQWDEIAKLPRTGGRIPALIVTDSPGPGVRRRCLVVLTLDDFTELHGRITEEKP